MFAACFTDGSYWCIASVHGSRNRPIPPSGRRSNVCRFLGPPALAAVDGRLGGVEAADGERLPEPLAGGFAERLLERLPPAPAVVEEGAEGPAGSSSAAGGAGSSAAASRTAAGGVGESAKT